MENSPIAVRKSGDLNNGTLSPRSRKNYEYRTERRRTDKRTTSRSFMARLDAFDMFAKPVINFNMRGRERVTSKLGLSFSFLLVCVVFYFVVVRLV